MGWGEWVARIGGYAAAPFTGGASIPIGEGIAQTLGNREAIADANQTQQQATQQALGLQQGAQQTNLAALNQQRADYQHQANAPYQTLAGLAGITIPNVGSIGWGGPQMSGQGPQAPTQPTAPVDPAIGSPMGKWARGAPTDDQRAEARGKWARPAEAQQSRQAQSQSGYQGSGTVLMRDPNTGEQQPVDARLVPIFRQRGAQVVG